MQEHEARLLLLREPAAINAAQIIGNLGAAFSGALSAAGGMPILVTGTIGPVLAVAVGSILMLGGLVGTFAVIRGVWWLERVGLLVTGVGWVCLIPAVLTAAASPRTTSAIWLVVALIITALVDIFKRYRRIDWAYLDPRR